MELLAKTHLEQWELCAQLEKIADSLPRSVDRQFCLQVALALNSVMARVHQVEEDQFFPVLEQSANLVANSPGIVERLRWDHLGDAYFVEEIVDVLFSYAAGKPAHGHEAAGYMLRGFLTGLRRHLAMEKELLGPALTQYDAHHAEPPRAQRA